MQRYCPFVDAEAIEERDERDYSGAIVVDGLNYGRISRPTSTSNAYVMSVMRPQGEIHDNYAGHKAGTGIHVKSSDSYDSDNSFIDNSEASSKHLTKEIRQMLRDSGSSFRMNPSTCTAIQTDQARRPQPHENPRHVNHYSQRHSTPAPTRHSVSRQCNTRWKEWRKKHKMQAKKEMMQAKKNMMQAQGQKRKEAKTTHRPEPTSDTPIRREKRADKCVTPGLNQRPSCKNDERWTCHMYKEGKPANSGESQGIEPKFHIKFERKKRIVIHESSSSDDSVSSE